MITLHHLEQSRSHRVLWLLEELELPYEIVRYARNPKTMLAPPELERVHPLGKSPVVTDDGRTVAESGAIIEYLIERHGGGRLAPAPGSSEQLRYRYYMHYAEGSLMPPLLVKLIAARVRSAPLPFFLKPVTRKIGDGLDSAYCDPNLRRHIAFLEGELASSTWFAGDELTGADIQMSYPVEALVTRGGLPVGPRLQAFVERARARPA
ncbi:MAG: glutathione S-transferase, partial [Deltaproteobacteria bacterium]|nr:glutathione S-transferase [Nannocystaceae bacterium]